MSANPMDPSAHATEIVPIHKRFVRWCGEWVETLRIAPPFSQRRRDILAAIADADDPDMWVEVERPDGADDLIELDEADFSVITEADLICMNPRHARAMVRLAAVVEAMVTEYGSFDGHDVWCPKSPHYEMVSDHPRGDRPCDCFAGALRTALADHVNRPGNPDSHEWLGIDR